MARATAVRLAGLLEECSSIWCLSLSVTTGKTAGGPLLAEDLRCARVVGKEAGGASNLGGWDETNTYANEELCACQASHALARASTASCLHACALVGLRNSPA
jgi:hypothetical protein